MNKLLTNYEQTVNKLWIKKWPILSYLAAVVPILYNGGYGFGEARSDKCPNRRGLVNSRQNSFLDFTHFYHPLPLSKNLTKQKFYSKIKQKRKEVKFLRNKKTKPQPRIHFSGKIKKGDPMKKAYSLNYDIYSTYDRIDAIAEILDELPQAPNHTDLE